MKVVSTEKAPKALGPYSQGYVHGGILYSAGQIGINPATDTVEADTIEGQAEQACKNIGEILKEAGTSFDKVLKTTCFLADMGDFAAFNEVYAKYFTSKPARSCVAVKTLPKNLLCEIEVIAAVEEESNLIWKEVYRSCQKNNRMAALHLTAPDARMQIPAAASHRI